MCSSDLVLTRGDVRHIAQDWSMTDDELETVMQRLDDAFAHGADEIGRASCRERV